ncbi:hypothetical protein WR25_26983 [Diploscapter pachys]|uniref:IkappaB kinase n=1 Tax=Diploscapter pachys TaxID=2018661 RepID=A0A2A2KBS6_9BILA|nr:hypothetical protein WR25_26983 [Diploscapter pachys]
MSNYILKKLVFPQAELYNQQQNPSNPEIGVDAVERRQNNQNQNRGSEGKMSTSVYGRLMEGEPYKILHNQIIGTGAFGVVSKGRTKSGALIAVKSCSKRNEIAAAQLEVEILKKCKGALNIVQYIGNCIHPAYNDHPEMYSFAMELAICSLEDFLRKPENRKGLPYNIIIDLVADCSSAMQTLQEKNIAHRDIKQLNILVFSGPAKNRRSKFLFKFCDFGGAKEAQGNMKTLVGSPGYLHPHLAVNLRMGPPKNWTIKNGYTGMDVDLWSLGCTLFYTACGEPPFPNTDGEVYYQAVVKLQQYPEAICCRFKGTQPNRTTFQYDYVYEYNNEVLNKRYPRWFVYAFSCLLRSLFHAPSIEALAKYAQILQKAKVHQFISVKDFEIFEYADLKMEPIFGNRYPTLKECLGMKPTEECQLISESEILPISSADFSRLRSEPYLIHPLTQTVDIPQLSWKTAASVKADAQIVQERQVRVRRNLISEGFGALDDGDKLTQIIEHTSKILQRQLEKARSDLLVCTSVIAVPDRFANYAESLSVAIYFATEQERQIVEECRQKAKQSHEELTRHAEMLNTLLEKVDELLRAVRLIQLEDVDIPGIRELLADYSTTSVKTEQELLEMLPETHAYTVSLVDLCIDRRMNLAQQIRQPQNGAQVSMLLNIYAIMSNLHCIVFQFEQCQKHVNDCAVILERPFQEMKNIVGKFAATNGLDTNKISKSVKIIANYEGVVEDTRKNYELAMDLARRIESMKMKRKDSMTSSRSVRSTSSVNTITSQSTLTNELETLNKSQNQL